LDARTVTVGARVVVTGAAMANDASWVGVPLKTSWSPGSAPASAFCRIAQVDQLAGSGPTADARKLPGVPGGPSADKTISSNLDDTAGHGHGRVSKYVESPG
jgi:hypothetical protein